VTGAAPLVLRVDGYTGPTRWRWVLCDAAGVLLADHEVRLDPHDPRYGGFARLGRYLRTRVDPAAPAASEAALVAELGEWIGVQVFGPVGAALAARAPAVVEVRPPAAAAELLYRPLELAYVQGRPLPLHPVTLVHVPPGPPPMPTPAAHLGPVRVLAVFSLPEGDSPLGLRAQRRALVDLFNRLRSRHRRDVVLRVLQWPATAVALRDALEYGDGWDVVHFSGHGLADGLTLETADGRAATLPGEELAALLRLARGRLGLVVLTSCHSAAGPAAASRWALLANPAAPGVAAGAVSAAGPPAAAGGRGVASLAELVVREVGCAVLAMRYAVADGFAIAVAEHLYDAMLRQDRSLPRALQLAVPKALAVPDTPPRSVATAALFGQRATGLLLRPGPAGPVLSTGDRPMAAFPPPPQVFVGRTGPMATVATALVADGVSGVCFTGPAGIGTTACAVELAYGSTHLFGALLWHRVDLVDGAIGGSLEAFAADMDRQAPELRLGEAVADAGRLAAYLPRLAELFETEAVLLVIDGVDALLSAAGTWRDPRWQQLMGALLDHHVLARTVLTGRRVPAPRSPRLAVVEIGPLTPAEAVQHAQDLPALGRLATADPEPAGGRPPVEVLAGMLTAAGGVPAAIVAAGRVLAAGGTPPSAPPAREYLDALAHLFREGTA
jgi:CHAT domain